jgi:hypothetical protein
VPEGVFTESGLFVPIPDIWKHRAAELWRERVFSLLLDTFKINIETVGNMRTWKHSGFSVDNSVRIAAVDQAGMQRLIEYISRCPFSRARMERREDSLPGISSKLRAVSPVRRRVADGGNTEDNAKDIIFSTRRVGILYIGEQK